MTAFELPVHPGGEVRSYRFRSETDPPPERLEIVGDTTPAGHALRAARTKTHLLYEGDERNARQMLQALGRRAIRRSKPRPEATPADIFNRERAARIEEHRVLSRLLVELGPGWAPRLRRATDTAPACEAAWGPWTEGPPVLCPLRELLGILGAYEWQRRGIAISALEGRIHPRWGVFAPTRPAYVDLVASAPMPHTGPLVFDLGTGTGVLGLCLAKRGAREVVATDVDPRAVECAADNARRLGLDDRFHAEVADVWPASPSRADVVVFNPPWLPGTPRSPIERAIFDPRGALLDRFLRELAGHLEPGGQGWLVMSDLAELLGMREPGHVERLAAKYGLVVVWERSAPAAQRRADAAARSDEDPEVVSRAREQERVVLTCLAAAQPT